MQKLFLLLSFFLFQSLLIAQSPGDSMMIGNLPDPEQIQTQDPTYKNFPMPEEVLVVYADSTLGDSSRTVAEYYASVRNIPNENIMPGLTIPLSITYPEGTVTVEQGGEDIRGADTLCWRFVRDTIAAPIERYLNNTYVNGQPLADRINYIVLIKGIPFKVRNLPYNDSTWSIRRKTHISVGSLLCLLNQPDPNKNFMQLYGTSISSQLSPLFQVDPNITMDYRFVSNHFVNSGGWYTQYLTSWLIGDTYADVIDLIDRLGNPDYSGEKTWILDGDPDASYHNFISTHQKLNNLGFYNVHDETQTWLTTNSNEVSGYVSHGVHAGMPANYILEELEFDYMPGANFLSWESFNAYSFGVLTSSQIGQGQISDFIHKEGSGGSGHVYEPWTDGVTYEDRTFPSYAMGYSMVDAQYHGIYYDAWRNMVIGDPLSTIAWGKQTTTRNISMSGTNLVTGVITISAGDTIAIESGATIRLRHNGFITSDGFSVITIGNNVTLDSDSWDRGLLLTDNHDHPQLLWTVNPSMSAVDYYKIYRKIDNGSFIQMDSVTGNVWTDYVLNFVNNEAVTNIHVYYYVKAFNSTSSSDPSNTVNAIVEKSNRKIRSTLNTDQFSYKLEQNYPNPFNPTTSISYSLKSDDFVSLKVYNILGQQVADLVDQNLKAGYHLVNFDASNLPSGIYIYKINTSSYTASKKMLLIK